MWKTCSVWRRRAANTGRSARWAWSSLAARAAMPRLRPLNWPCAALRPLVRRVFWTWVTWASSRACWTCWASGRKLAPPRWTRCGPKTPTRCGPSRPKAAARRKRRASLPRWRLWPGPSPKRWTPPARWWPRRAWRTPAASCRACTTRWRLWMRRILCGWISPRSTTSTTTTALCSRVMSGACPGPCWRAGVTTT